MARAQIQLPGFANSQPQASPTDQFVQAKLRLPVPSHIRDLMPFSKTLTEIIAQSQIDTHERQRAQGAADATFTTPFGAGVADSPENDANRKAWAAQIASGKILASESPWYRIGVFEAEGRRAGLDVHANVVTPANMDVQAKIYDGHGNFIMPGDREDANAIFQRQAAPFLNVPALQTTYGKNAAVAIVANAQAQFVAGVAERRDRNTQQYHETQLTDQFVAMLDRVQEASQNQDQDGLYTKEQAIAGLHDFVNSSTVGRNVPDPQGVFRQAVTAYIGKQTEIGAEAGIAAVDLVRDLPIGTTTIAGDNSKDGLVLRAALEQKEEDLNRHANDSLKRKLDLVDLQSGEDQRATKRAITLKYAEKGPTGMSRDPLAVKNELDAFIRQEGGEYMADRLAMNAATYEKVMHLIEEDPIATEELRRRLRRMDGTAAQLKAETAALADAHMIPEGQAAAMDELVDKAEAVWRSRSDVTGGLERIDERLAAMNVDKGTPAGQRINKSIADRKAQMMANIESRISEKAPNDLAGRADIVKQETEAADIDVKAIAEGLANEKKSVADEQMVANDKGLSSMPRLKQAWDDGVLNLAEFTAAKNADEDARSVIRWTGNSVVENVKNDAIQSAVNKNKELKFGIQQVTVNARADRLIREFVAENRAGMPETEFKAKFNTWAQTTLLKDLIGVAEEVPTEVTFESKGLTSVADRLIQGVEPKLAAELQREWQSGSALQDAIGAENVYGVRPAAVALWSIPKEAGIGTPAPVRSFLDSYGRSPADLADARTAAREALGKAYTKTGYTEDQQAAYRKALVSTGFATPEEILAGSIKTADGREIKLEPGDAPPWTTQYWKDDAEYDRWRAKTPELIFQLGKSQGIDMDNPVEAATWLARQQALRNGATVTPQFYNNIRERSRMGPRG